MSVTDEFRIDIRPYSAYEDPSFPIAAYVAQGGSVGDGTAGNLFMQFLFKRTADNAVSELFSLEQLAIDSTGTANVEGTIKTLNMDSLAINRPLSPQTWRVLLQPATGMSVPTAMDTNKNNFLPLWLGAPFLGEGNSGLEFEWPNTDLRLYQVIIQGYIWGPRSVLAPGGPRRPISGLFHA